jgi:ketosteroid isomerase-like protein
MYKLLFSISLICLIGCSVKPDNNKQTFNLTVIKQYIDSSNINYAERFVQKDSIWWASKYCKDACTLAPNQVAVCGIDSIKKYFYTGVVDTSFKMIIKATTIYGSEAIVVEEGVYDFPTRNGSLDKGKFIAIWKQEDGKWKLFKEIWNSDLAISNLK